MRVQLNQWNAIKGKHMKTTRLLVLPGLLALFSSPPAGSAPAQPGTPAAYTVTDVGTLGGPYSFPYAINDAGVVAGGAATAAQTDFLSQTAFVWSGGQPINLGTLDGAACPDCSSEAAAASAAGQVGVISERAALDPNGEDFCGFGTFRQCVATVWKNGALRLLERLPGGLNSAVFYANSRGAMVGFSETGVADGSCVMPFQATRFQAVKWGSNGRPAALRLLPGDTVSFAMALNESGQAVGGAGQCANTILPPQVPHAQHAMFWDRDGTPIDLGTPAGGAGDNVATGINNRGDVVENSVMIDGTVHAFVWNRSAGTLHDLGTYPSDAPVTVAPCCNVINDRGQVVGFSVDTDGNMRAILWQDSVAVDLNTLLPADSPWYALIPGGINQAGEIAVVAVNVQTSEVHAVVLSPAAGTALAARGPVKPPKLPASVRRLVQPRTFQ
jgi:probable HAF family extracellular repeat protein